MRTTKDSKKISRRMREVNPRILIDDDEKQKKTRYVTYFPI